MVVEGEADGGGNILDNRRDAAVEEEDKDSLEVVGMRVAVELGSLRRAAVVARKAEDIQSHTLSSIKINTRNMN